MRAGHGDGARRGQVAGLTVEKLDAVDEWDDERVIGVQQRNETNPKSADQQLPTTGYGGQCSLRDALLARGVLREALHARRWPGSVGVAARTV